MSNDVRRFDDSAVFWVFLWAGPLELMIVLALLIELLGPAAAFAGIASLLLVIPLQVRPWVADSYRFRLRLRFRFSHRFRD